MKTSVRTPLLITAALGLWCSVGQAATYESTVTGYGPLGYWRFNETASSPSINKVANIGSLASTADGYALNSVTKGEAGVAGNSIRMVNLGGTGDCRARVDVPYSSALNPGVFSVEVWIKPTSYAGTDDTGTCIMTSLNSNGFNSANRQGWVMYMGNTGRLQFWLGLNSGYAGQLRSSGIIPLNSWSHILATYDGTTIRAYLNGVAVGSTNATGWSPNPQAVLRLGGSELNGTFSPAATRPAIAASGVVGNRGFDGWMDEAAVYGAALSAATAKAHYDAVSTNLANYGTQILGDAPVAFWRMEDAPISAPARTSLPIAANIGSVGSAADATNEWGTAAAQPGASYAGFGGANNAVYFDGVNGSMGLPDAAGLHFSGNITLMAWIKPQFRDYYRNIIANGLDDARAETFLRVSRVDDGGLGGTTTNYYEVGVCNGVPSGFNLIWPGGTDNYYHSAVSQIPAGDFNNWVFLAGTYDGSNWKLYRNGVQVGTIASTHGALDITNRWSIGSRADPNPAANPPADPTLFAAHGERFGGYIDEPAIFNTALAASDILAIYNAAQVPPIITRAVANPGNVFKGQSASFNVWAEGSPALSHLWLSNGVSTGITTTNFTVGGSGFQVGSHTIAVAVSNPYGSVTSSVTFSVVAAAPSFTTQPVPAARYVGRPFTFTVAVAGSTPMSLQWKTNGVAIPGATSTSYSDTASLANAFNYSCTASNEAGQVDSTAVALTVKTVPAGYATAVFGDTPIAYWRLGEPSGSVAYDYYNGKNGQYFNASLGQPGYSVFDSDTAATFAGTPNSYVGNISGDPVAGVNFQGHTNFTLEAWVNGPPGQAGQSSIIAKGNGDSGTVATEQFSIDVEANPGAGGAPSFHFFTRGGGGAIFEAFADVGPDGTWQHVVGVYDDLNVLGMGAKLHIYVNGELRGSGDVRPSGIRASTFVVSIGAKRLGNSATYDGVFTGTIDEVAAYSYALTYNQISNHYALPYGTTTKPTITKQPVSVTVYSNFPARFDVAAFGSQPLTYQWKKGGVDLVDGGTISGASTRALVIDPAVPSDAGNYSVTVNNAVGPATNSSIAVLTVLAAPTNTVILRGMVLHMKFDGTLNDSTVHANHGTGKHTTLTSTNNASPGANSTANPDFYYNTAGAPDSVMGQSLHYHTATTNGGNSDVTNSWYVSLGDPADLHFGTSQDLSVAYWVRFPPFNGVGDLGDLPFLASAVNSYGNTGFTFAPSYQLGSWSYSFNGAVQLYGADYLIDDGAWHHVAHSLTRAGNAVSYIDGRQVDTRAMAAAGNLDSGHPVCIGQDPTGKYPEEGYYDLDDMIVWRRALSQQEIVALYLASTLGYGAVDINPYITPGPGANQITIKWEAGTLQSAPAITGPWTDVPAATSPYTTSATDAKVYRTRYPQ